MAYDKHSLPKVPCVSSLRQKDWT